MKKGLFFLLSSCLISSEKTDYAQLLEKYPLYEAYCKENYEAVTTILEKTPDQKMCSDVLLLALLNPQPTQFPLVSLIIEKGIAQKDRRNVLNSLLVKICIDYHYESCDSSEGVTFLLKNGAHPNAPNLERTFETPYLIGIARIQSQIKKIMQKQELLTKMAPIKNTSSKSDLESDTIIRMLQAKNVLLQDLKRVLVLKKAGGSLIDTRNKDKDGCTVLHYLAATGKGELRTRLELLLESKKKPKIADEIITAGLSLIKKIDEYNLED